MLTYPAWLEVRILVWAFLYFHTSCIQEAKPLPWLCLWAFSLEPLLLEGAIFKYQNIVFWPITLVILRPLQTVQSKSTSGNGCCKNLYLITVILPYWFWQGPLKPIHRIGSSGFLNVIIKKCIFNMMNLFVAFQMKKCDIFLISGLKHR